jgi:hypothetical protein
VNKDGLTAVDRVCEEVAADIDLFGPGAGLVLGRIMRNVGPLRDMASDAFRARIVKALANTVPEPDMVNEYADRLMAQL